MLLFVNEEAFYNTYSEQLTYERALVLFTNVKQLQWIVYALIPISVLVKSSLISIIVFTGVFLVDNNASRSIGKIFGVVLASEIVFIIAGLIKLVWLCLFSDGNDLNQISFFFPLSLGNFFKYSEIDKIWIFPLQTLNLFQVGYILLLSFGIHYKLGLVRQSAEKAILISYLPCLLLVITLFMFITVGH